MTRDRSEVFGLSVLAFIVIATSSWIVLERRKLNAMQAPAIPELKVSPGLDRFDRNAWYLSKDEQFGLIEIPAGTFIMGSDPRKDAHAFQNERWSSQSFQGNVDVPGFYIFRYETTVAQFRAFVEEAGYRFDASALRSPGDFPITQVSWTDAIAYADWLTEKLRSSSGTPTRIHELLQSGWRFTLPSEAQWEKAARTSDGRVYPWGDMLDRALANFASYSPVPVGTFSCASCAHGLADMSGNVWELTRSPYQSYPYDDKAQRGDLHSDALYVMRGGSFNDTDTTIRTATRGGVDPGARRGFIGFRLVLTNNE